MKIIYDPSPDVPGPSGIVSYAAWHNPDLQAAIRLAFHESPRERIVEIVITRDGIKAVFELSGAAE